MIERPIFAGKRLLRVAVSFCLLLPLLALGAPAAFSFTDLGGHAHDMAALRGKWVLVNFWAPWCPPCWADVPVLNKLSERKNLHVFSIAMDYRDEDSVRYFMKRFKVDFPVVMGGNSRDATNAATLVGKVPFYPTTFLFDPQGNLATVIHGILNEDEVAVALGKEAAARP